MRGQQRNPVKHQLSSYKSLQELNPLYVKTYEHIPLTNPETHTSRDFRTSYSTVRPCSIYPPISLRTLKEPRVLRGNAQANKVIPVVPLSLNTGWSNTFQSTRSASNKQKYEILRDNTENRLASTIRISTQMEGTTTRNTKPNKDSSVGYSLMKEGVIKAYAFNTNQGAVR